MTTPEQRLRDLGFTLPPAPEPVGSYVPCVRTGGLIITSGQLPMQDGKLAATGKVGRDVTLEQGADAAQVAVINGLAQIARAAGGLDAVEQVVRLGVFVNSAPGFTDQARVANGASDLLVGTFGDAGRHARTAVGVSDLPLDSAVELELIVRVRP
jgi:enamine deaminase RidA (YjgF/YER057c/UK114 family)